jgi:hypothetical protein
VKSESRKESSSPVQKALNVDVSKLSSSILLAVRMAVQMIVAPPKMMKKQRSSPSRKKLRKWPLMMAK